MSKISNYLYHKNTLAKNISKENGQSRVGKTIEKPAEVSDGSKARQTLGVIQPSVGHGLTRQSEKSSKQKKIIPQSQVRVFEDPKAKKLEIADVEVQTELSGPKCLQCIAQSTPVKTKSAEQEAHELMVQEDVPTDYWKALAEERRQALEDSLLENELLHTEVSQLKDENEKLGELAGQAEYFAEMFKMVTEVDEAEKASSEQASPKKSDDSDTEDGAKGESLNEVTH